MFAIVSYNLPPTHEVLVMKLNARCGVLLLAVATLGAGAAGSALAAQPAATGSSAAPAVPTARAHQGRFFHGGPGSFMLGSLLRATRQLNLTADQQSQIKSILSSARSQGPGQGGAGMDITVLGNPADPNYATALQTAKAAAANRLQLESEVQGQVYNVLTTEQKTQLPTVLAGMKAQMAARRAQHHAVAPN
jgi:Spy/CpxP family protein refolding chaperone